jgi:hypothetical protein
VRQAKHQLCAPRFFWLARGLARSFVWLARDLARPFFWLARDLARFDIQSCAERLLMRATACLYWS